MGEMFGDGTKRIFLDTLAFWSSEVRGENYACAVVDGVLDCRKRSSDAGVVVNFAVFDRDVEVDAKKHALATKSKIFYRKLSHEKAQKDTKKKANNEPVTDSCSR